MRLVTVNYMMRAFTEAKVSLRPGAETDQEGWTLYLGFCLLFLLDNSLFNQGIFGLSISLPQAHAKVHSLPGTNCLFFFF